MRVVITRVLPVPAPARTSSGPSVVVDRVALRGVQRREEGGVPPARAGRGRR